MINFAALCQAWPQGVIVLDEQHQVVFANAKTCEITGYSEGQLLNNSIAEWLEGDGTSFREEFLTGKISYLLEHERVSIPQWWLANSGEFIEVEAQQSPVEVDGQSFILITFQEFDDPEESLFFVRKLAAFPSLSPQPLAQIGVDGALEYSNDCLNDLMLEFGFDEAGHACVFPKKWQQLAEKCLAGEKAISAQHEVASHWYEWTFHPVLDQSIPFILLIGSDITEHIKHQRSLESINRLQLQNSKQKSEYMTTLYAEMQTPLLEIQTHVELLNRGSLTDNETQWVKDIYVASKVLKSLVDDSEDRLSIESNRFELRNREFNPRLVVTQTLEMLSAKISAKALNYYLWINPRITTKIQGDAKRFSQVFRVLLNNAVDYTERGAIIVQLQVRTMSNRQWLRLSVTDSGIGISPRKVGALFSASANFGHALAYVKQVVSMMGGQVGVQSVEGRGSSFFIDLPNDAEETSPPEFTRQPRVALNIVDGIWKNSIEQYLSFAEVVITEPEDADLFISDQAPSTEAATSLYIGQGRPKQQWDYILNGHASPTLLYDILQSVVSDGENKSVTELEKILQTNSVDVVALNLVVLLVDDNPNNLTVFSDVVKNMGCQVLVADSGDEAISQWFMSGGTISLILLDCKMPMMDGYQTAEKLREENFDGPIIGMTNRRWQDELDDAIHAGMTTCTTKPLDFDELYNLVSDLT